MEESTKKDLREAAALAAKAASGAVVLVTAFGYLEPRIGRHFAREAFHWAKHTWKDLDEWVEKG